MEPGTDPAGKRAKEYFSSVCLIYTLVLFLLSSADCVTLFPSDTQNVLGGKTENGTLIKLSLRSSSVHLASSVNFQPKTQRADTNRPT